MKNLNFVTGFLLTFGAEQRMTLKAATWLLGHPKPSGTGAERGASWGERQLLSQGKSVPSGEGRGTKVTPCLTCFIIALPAAGVQEGLVV